MALLRFSALLVVSIDDADLTALPNTQQDQNLGRQS